MSFPEAIAQCLRKYVDFSGRASRAEFWWWELATTGIIVVLGLMASFLSDASDILSTVEGLFILAIFLPTWAVTMRRLHDIGKSGWWLVTWVIIGSVSGVFVLVGAVMAFGLAFLGTLFGDSGLVAIGFVVFIIGLVPYAGTLLWMILWLARQGDAGPNRYGPDPSVM